MNLLIRKNRLLSLLFAALGAACGEEFSDDEQDDGAAASVMSSNTGMLTEPWLVRNTATQKASGWNGSGGAGLDSRNPRFLLTLPSRQAVQLNLTSEADSRLCLTNDAGTQVVTCSGAAVNIGVGWRSRIEATLEAGRYLVIPGASAVGERADFVVETSAGRLDYCFTAYEHAYFGGRSTLFCGGQAPSELMNDTYSSLRVPRGMYVRAFEHMGQVGLARTYYSDVAWVGELYNDKFSSFRYGDFAGHDFFMVMASDSQFAWSHCSDGEGPLCDAERRTYPGMSTEELGRMYNGRVVAAINRIKRTLGDERFGGVIVNGDLTDFGDQGSDLRDYILTYEHSLEANVYLGLGNHDYANNVDDCWMNQCASTMVWYLKEQVYTLNPVGFDYSQSGTYYRFPLLRRDHLGSLAYSWEIGNIHFVQLNNFAGYARSWKGWNFSEWREDSFLIRPSFDWLRMDLSTARSAKRRIVLNVHDVYSTVVDTRFAEVLEGGSMAGIFGGHVHGQSGEVARLGYEAVPGLLSGAAHQGTFLVVRFTATQMFVWLMAVDPFDGGRLTVQHGGALQLADNLETIFNAGGTAPSTYTYAYVFDSP